MKCTERCITYAGRGRKMCFSARNQDMQSRGRDGLWDDLINSCCDEERWTGRALTYVPSFPAMVHWLAPAEVPQSGLVPLLSLCLTLMNSFIRSHPHTRHMENCLPGRLPSLKHMRTGAISCRRQLFFRFCALHFLFGLCFGFNFPHMIELWILGRMRFFSFRETLK